jgi:peptidoglycan hydrolase FlgJ
MSVTTNASAYTDLQSLAVLRGQAKQKSPAAMREASRQFEALFVQMMLKSMREAKLGDGMGDSDQSAMYQEMYDKQISLEMTRQRGVGLAEMIMKQLGGTSAVAPPPAMSALSPAMQSLRAQLSAVNAPSSSESDQALPGDAGNLPALVAPSAPSAGTPVDGSTPQAFVQSIWPHAQQAARALGVKPEVLVAQAALETGWGRSVMQHPDGSSSNNLFGIKANPAWEGRQVSVPTLEYSNGIPVRTSATFRAYGSIADSFSDYVDFLKSNPRYRNALVQAGNPNAFTAALQQAGYATDPAYAQKINAIVNGDTLQGAVSQVKQQVDIAQLKQAGNWPLT